MALAKKCDICGVLYEGYNINRYSNDTNGIRFVKIGDIGQCINYRTIDCCPECMKSIKNHIDGLKKKVMYREADINDKNI